MNYPPKIHQEKDKNQLISVIKTYPLGTIISVKNGEPLITHLPLIYKEGYLIGHLDKFNPQADLLKNNNTITVLFSGPQCYISPSIYSTNQLPTWNYIKVHLQGTVNEIINPIAIKQSMVDLTSYLEYPENKYELKIDDPKMDRLIDYVIGFEIKITQWEGKFKLSQDKKPKDIQNAKNQLIKANQESIKSFLDHII